MRSDFEKTLKQHRDSLAEELLQLGKYREAQLVEWDIEQNESDYEFYFNSGWNAQQSKVDELQHRNKMLIDSIKEQGQKLVYQNEVIETQSEKLLGLRDEKAELQKRLDALTHALDKIAYPIPHMQKEAEINGCELNGYWAVKMSEDHTYSKDIARKALEKEQALKGGDERRK